MEYGWPEEKIAVKGNFVKGTTEYTENTEGGKKEQIVYVGRLSKEKGVETLIKAFKIQNHGKYGKYGELRVRNH